MGERINVEPQKLQEASSRFSESSAKYKKIAASLMEKATTMGNAWAGDDNQTYVNQIKGFTEELDNMASKLNTISLTLSEQGTNYSNRQKSNEDDVRKLQN